MSTLRVWFGKHLASLLGLVVVVVSTVLIPWPAVWSALVQLRPLTILGLLGLSLIYFLAKAIRFQHILSRLGSHPPLARATLIYWGAQPMTFLPGGEFYRTVLFEQYGAVPPVRTSSAVVLQAMVELIALVAITFVAVLARGQFLLQVVVLALAVLALAVVLQQGWIPKASLLNHLPFVHLSQQKLTRFRTANSALLKPDNIVSFLWQSLIPIAAGIGLVSLSAYGLGLSLGWAELVLAYTVPILVSYVAVVPGFGEWGGMGTLLLFGVALPTAIALVLLLKLFTQGVGLILGPGSQLWLRLHPTNLKDHHA